MIGKKNIPDNVMDVLLDLKKNSKNAGEIWANEEDDGDSFSASYVRFCQCQRELRGFVKALELLGYEVPEVK